jgi:DNA-binding phage protein
MLSVITSDMVTYAARALLIAQGEHNKRDARSDAAKAATHYMRAYFLHKDHEMILSIKILHKRIKTENRAIAMLYETILEGDYDIDFVNAIRNWVAGSISLSS